MQALWFGWRDDHGFTHWRALREGAVPAGDLKFILYYGSPVPEVMPAWFAHHLRGERDTVLLGRFDTDGEARGRCDREGVTVN